MNMYLPFTYLIGWSHLNKWYYGVRYAKSANPTELWTTYFTSSPKVTKFRQEFGEPDVIEVRHTFTDKFKAKLWETKILRVIPKDKRTNWLNRKFGSFGICASPGLPKGFKHCEETKQRMSRSAKGKIKTPEHLANLRIARNNRAGHSQETREKIGNSNRGRKRSEETKIKMRLARAAWLHTNHHKK